MSKYLFHLIILLLILPLTSCFLAVDEDPNVPIESLGTLIKPDVIYSLNSDYGPIEIEYLGPTSRIFRMNNVEYVLELMKSEGLNGVFNKGYRFPDINDGIKGIIYEEGTSLTPDSPSEVRDIFVGKFNYSRAEDYDFLFKVELSKKHDQIIYVSLLKVAPR